MKKALLSCVAMAATLFAVADEWQLPVYSGAFQPLPTEATTVYIYNTEAKMFLLSGNEWGTHASVREDGYPFTITPYVAEEEGATWDGKTYVLESFEGLMFITDGGHIYLDRREQEDYFFSFKALDGNTYQIYGADSNPTWNATGDNANYMVGRYTKYVYVDPSDSENTEETGTGVIYDYNGDDSSYGAGEFQTTWAFVSTEDYEAYDEELRRYNAAQYLKELLDDADAIGTPNLEAEKAVYANTKSTLEEINDAADSVEKKTLAYYEVYVTPDNSMQIHADDCSSIDWWVNDINATTWGTQTWVDDTWLGFYAPTLDIWGASMKGQAYKELTGLPNGIYEVTIAAYSKEIDGAVFANLNKTAVGAGAAGKSYQVTTNVTDGTLRFGFEQDTEGTNWVAIDNVFVTYYGKGTEALKYWLNSLKESAPDFSGVTVQQELVDAWNTAMSEAEKATTEEEILAAIPKLDDALQNIDLNIAAYKELQAAIDEANELLLNPELNKYYGDLLGDEVSDMENAIAKHTLSTEDVKALVKKLQDIAAEAQSYLWDWEELTNEQTTAANIYAEYKETCTAEADAAYKAFVEKMNTLDAGALTDEDVNKLLSELYDIEFNLQLSSEPASDDNPVDYTAKVQYPGFEGGKDGWVNDGWSTFDAQTNAGEGWNPAPESGEVLTNYYLNLWNTSNARAYQIITGLPAGTYMLQISAHADAEGLQVYANSNYLNVVAAQPENKKNKDDVAYIYDGKEAVTIEGTVEYGSIYRITTVVGEDGTLEIGARNTNDGEIWAMIDNVELTYYGTESKKEPTNAISSPKESSPSVTAIYTLSGTKVSALQKGINLVKMSDGSVKKVLVK